MIFLEGLISQYKLWLRQGRPDEGSQHICKLFLPNNHKNLNLSSKTDLEFGYYLGRENSSHKQVDMVLYSNVS